MKLSINVGDSISVGDLLRHQEGENLDYKSSYPTVNSDLLHDILCLSNSVIDSDRFLVFGVNDDKTVSGVETDQNRKNQADIINVLNNRCWHW